MFENTRGGLKTEPQRTIKGEEAERLVLGFQDKVGLGVLREHPVFSKSIDELAEKLYLDGFVEKIRADYEDSEKITEDEWKKIIREKIISRFFDAGFTKKKQDQDLHEREISTFIAERYSFGEAATQIRLISLINQRQNLESFNKNLSTPFTIKLSNALAYRIKTKFPNLKFKIEYYSALFEAPEVARIQGEIKTKSYLDAMRGADAFIIIERGEGKEKQTDVFYLDYTGDPKKTSDHRNPPPVTEVLINGMQHKKIVAYLDSSRVQDEDALIDLGTSVANSMASRLA